MNKIIANAPAPRRFVITDRGQWTLHASLIERPALGPNPVCMITFDAPAWAAGRESFRAQFRLTARESDVASLLANGLRNGAIASQLGISVHTVRRHVEQILQKTITHTRTEAAAKLRR